MRQYVLYQRRHARITMRGLTEEQRLKKQAEELREWKRALVQGLRRKFSEASIEGFVDKGVLVTLQEDSPSYLRRLHDELDCVFQVYTPAT